MTDAGLAQLRFPDESCVLRIANVKVSDAAVQMLQRKYPKCRIDRSARLREKEALEANFP